jgi:NADH:ubiquinone oxidoreductase subunit 6 (subunit J)
VDLVVFFLASVAAIASAVALVVQRNPFISALALLGNLVSLAALMLLLEAQFVAAAQVIVYAGAVMVMFLFVIAYVGPRGEIGPGSRKPWQVWLAVLAALFLAIELVLVILRTAFDDWPAVDAAYGSPAAIGQALVTDYLLAFEVVSVILFMAAVAGVVFGSGGRPRRLSTDEVIQKEIEAAEERRRADSRAALDAAAGEGR